MNDNQRNCLILGSGRSGTSMVAGLLANAGYFMGEAPIGPGNPANPKGFFEDPEINRINEKLIARTVKRYRRNPLNRLFQRERLRELELGTMQRWLAPLPVGIRIRSTPKLEARIRALTARQPFCFKDPRFSYTWHIWRRFIPADPLLICVFRHPSITAASMVSLAKTAPYLRDVQMDLERAERVWESIYRSVLDVQYRKGGQWLFLHYDQVMDGSAFPTIERSLGIAVDHGFPDAQLRRSKPQGATSPQAEALYQRLCELAHYQG